MDLTIVIVSFQSGEILHRCLKSINNKYPVIIIENSINYNLKVELENKYQNLKCILPDENLGYGAGNNLGIKQAKTKYVLILNPDTILNDKTIPNLLLQANIHKDFAIMGPRVIENENITLNSNENICVSVEYLKGFAILFNKEKFKDLDYFDENYFLYFEEIDLCKRIINSGNKIYLVKNSLIKHIGGHSHEEKFSFEIELSRNWHWMWSTFYYYKKNYNYFHAFRKVYKNLFSSIIKLIFYSIILNSKKRKIYFQRLSGIVNAIIGKKSWYRPIFKK
ncbi:MAG: glycosyltransferase family 2 protein [Candidatus Pelagibacter sp. TMED239]|nr:MAG: glycosyltransferase family 2 protein [Candidatus Pelagibacter sp. TMED239]|tara:strand:- start:486 stop:1322 length:837 start_codon:yes stop_codon:yes gene_type:complete